MPSGSYQGLDNKDAHSKKRAGPSAYMENMVADVAEALRRLVNAGEEACVKAKERKSAFDLNMFMKRTYVVVSPSFPTGCSIPCYAQHERRIVFPSPTSGNIRGFLRLMCVGSRLAPECLIVALIYVNRLCNGKRAVRLSSRNWLPIAMVSLLTASKVWEDNPTWNGAFAQLFPPVTLRGLNQLESTFHAQLQFNLQISESVYNKYLEMLQGIQKHRKKRGKMQIESQSSRIIATKAR
mmetsp:Transcript_908/g.1249  ORF Transcript_908/g.1249 Transcript_908/m.1249 type:complete len:238 (+) Transcript_908:94-807(+)